MKHLPPDIEPDIYKFEQKWSPEIAIYNFTQVPNLLLNCQGHLGLTDGELLTLIHLLSHWYRHDSNIYPSINRLSKFSQKGYSTIQKRLKSLEDKEFIKRRYKQGTSSTYDVIPCIVKLYQHEKVCTDPPRLQSHYWEKASSPIPSLLKNKEDNYSRRLNFNNTKNPHDSFFDTDTGGRLDEV
jgi:predicted transcriptional regulator